MGWRVRKGVSELIARLKGESSRQMTHYYQFYNNYIHEFVNYTKLVQRPRYSCMNSTARNAAT